MKSQQTNSKLFILLNFFIISLLSLTTNSHVFAQSTDENSSNQSVQTFVNVDLFSQYIWRGLYFGDISIQPAFTVAHKGFSFTTFGNVGFDKTESKTIGLVLGYKNGGFKALITDFWCSDAFTFAGAIPHNYFDYDARTTTHNYELTVGYDFKYVALEWNTMFAGEDYHKFNAENPNVADRSFSTYIELSAPFQLGAVDFKAHLGVSPWESRYSDDLNVVSAGVKAMKTFYTTSKLAIPVSLQLIANPDQKMAYFVAGIGLAF